MANYNKQATKAKNSNLYAIDILVVLGTIVFGTLLYLFAPEIFEAFAKFLAILVMVGAVVALAIYSIMYEPYEEH